MIAVSVASVKLVESGNLRVSRDLTENVGQTFRFHLWVFKVSSFVKGGLCPRFFANVLPSSKF